jgi:hypothetical protein
VSAAIRGRRPAGVRGVSQHSRRRAAEWFKGEWVSLRIYAITREQWGREPHSRA